MDPSAPLQDESAMGQVARKFTISYEEYHRLSQLIVITMQEFARSSGMESVTQAEIVNKMV